MAIDRDGLHTIGVVGAVAMGAGIAQTALAVGLKVVLHDANRAALAQAREQILARIARQIEKGQLPESAAAQTAANLVLADDLTAFSSAQVVVEAIIETLEPKQKLFAALEKHVGQDTLLATNTSSLSVAAIARGCERRDRVCGMHFFNPVPLMKLVEVIAAPDTSRRMIDTALALVSRLDKTAVEVTDAPGFLVNLIGRAYPTEGLHVAQEGVAPVAVIDRIMREAAGFRMGPFELMDLTGIDVNFPASSFIYRGFQNDPRLKTTILHESLFNAGRFGRKTGQGFYAYPGESKSPPQDSSRAAPVSLSAYAPEHHGGFAQLAEQGLDFTTQDGADVILISPDGEDAATVAVRLNLPPARVVAVDFLGLERKFLTLMAPLSGDGRIAQVADYLRGKGYAVAVIKDSPGFVAPRILSMIANLGCEAAQVGIGSPEDIDLAMRLAQNYPRGPFEWAEWLGPRRVFDTLRQIQEITGSDRYRPSLWLRRRALLGLPIHTRD
jgi:3-hydroxybutyryl-CoA dehydrogenase